MRAPIEPEKAPRDPEPPQETETIARAAVLHHIEQSLLRLTPLDIKREMARTHGWKRHRVKRLLRGLVESGEIAYTYEHGCTFVEKAFSRPVRLSARVVVMPPDCSAKLGAGDIGLRLSAGAAFGAGNHPTTRLALGGLEYIFRHQPDSGRRPDRGHVLDVGTGSGILVLAAVMLGMQKGLGLDIDPCALAEARANVALNRLEARVEISDSPLATIPGRFQIVLANLRPPTLGRLRQAILRATDPGGRIVFSGMRPGEVRGIIGDYAGCGCDCLWQKVELGWAGVVLRKGADCIG